MTPPVSMPGGDAACRLTVSPAARITISRAARITILRVMGRPVAGDNRSLSPRRKTGPPGRPLNGTALRSTISADQMSQ